MKRLFDEMNKVKFPYSKEQLKNMNFERGWNLACDAHTALVNKHRKHFYASIMKELNKLKTNCTPTGNMGIDLCISHIRWMQKEALLLAKKTAGGNK